MVLAPYLVHFLAVCQMGHMLSIPFTVTDFGLTSSEKITVLCNGFDSEISVGMGEFPKLTVVAMFAKI